MIAENIQSSFWHIENEILFHFIVKIGNLKIWKRGKALNLTTVHFKIWNFHSIGSPVNDDKKITFESDKKGSLLSELRG